MKGYFLLAIIGLALAGCASSDTPQASDEVKKNFAGGPMPPEARKQFEESMKRSQSLSQEKAHAGGQTQ